MTAPRDPDRMIHAFLREGADRLQDQVYDVVRAEIDRKRQRVVIGPWRMPTLNKLVPWPRRRRRRPSPGSRFIGSLSSNVGGPAVEPTATATPESTPPPTPSPASAPPLTQSFTSTLHGISVSYPERWTAQAAIEPWEGQPFPNFKDPSADVIYDPVHAGELWLMLASTPPEASDPDRWPADMFAATECSSTEPVSVDGATGLIGADFDSTECTVVFVTTGGRGFQIRLYDSNDEGAYDRPWLEEVLATVQLHPEDAVDAGASPSP
jgi:hypothetical protein